MNGVRTDRARASRRKLGQTVYVLIHDRKYRGKVIGIDMPDQPLGVLVELDKPLHGVTTAYATHNELSSR